MTDSKLNMSLDQLIAMQAGNDRSKQKPKPQGKGPQKPGVQQRKQQTGGVQGRGRSGGANNADASRAPLSLKGRGGVVKGGNHGPGSQRFTVSQDPNRAPRHMGSTSTQRQGLAPQRNLPAAAPLASGRRRGSTNARPLALQPQYPGAMTAPAMPYQQAPYVPMQQQPYMGMQQQQQYIPAQVQPRIQLAPAVPATATSSKLFISNLGPRVTEDDLNELFSTCGQVKEFALHYAKDGKMTGTGHVVMERAVDAKAALAKFNNVSLDQRKLEIAIMEVQAPPEGTFVLSSGKSVTQQPRAAPVQPMMAAPMRQAGGMAWGGGMRSMGGDYMQE